MSLISWADLAYNMQQLGFETLGLPETPTATRDEIVTAASTKAEGLMYSAVAGRFPDSVPFTVATLPSVCKTHLISLGVWYLASDAHQTVGESTITNYTAALTFFQAVQDRKQEIYSEATGALLSEYDSTYGVLTDAGQEYDEWEDDYRAFSRTGIESPPSTFPHQSHDDDTHYET